MQLRGWENDRPSCFHLGFTEKLIPGNDGKYIAQKSYRRIHEAIKPYRCWKGKQFLSRHSSWSALASLRLSNSQRNVDFPTSNAPAYCEQFDVMEKHCVNASSNKISILRRTEKKKLILKILRTFEVTSSALDPLNLIREAVNLAGSAIRSGLLSALIRWTEVKHGRDNTAVKRSPLFPRSTARSSRLCAVTR